MTLTQRTYVDQIAAAIYQSVLDRSGITGVPFALLDREVRDSYRADAEAAIAAIDAEIRDA